MKFGKLEKRGGGGGAVNRKGAFIQINMVLFTTLIVTYFDSFVLDLKSSAVYTLMVIEYRLKLEVSISIS